MIHIRNLKNGYPIYDALSSPVRIEILDLLHRNSRMNLDDIAKALHFTNGAITKHIKKLSESGLITVTLASSRRGTEKICSLADEKILIELIPNDVEEKSYEVELDAGQYSTYDIAPTCGLASTEKFLCELDDVRYFSHPDRFKANIIWFTSGYVEYRFPNPVQMGETVKEIQISLEIASEAPGVVEHFPSDIHFLVNDKEICCYHSPGEFFDRKGRFTPGWLFENFGQYGRIKIISVSDSGTYLDGLYGSDVTVKDLNIGSDFSFKISVPAGQKFTGGATIFGKGFGDYNQGIKIKILV